jgi:hypothetical protein
MWFYVNMILSEDKIKYNFTAFALISKDALYMRLSFNIKF